jgi:hypothetical protein
VRRGTAVGLKCFASNYLPFHFQLPQMHHSSSPSACVIFPLTCHSFHAGCEAKVQTATLRLRHQANVSESQYIVSLISLPSAQTASHTTQYRRTRSQGSYSTASQPHRRSCPLNPRPFNPRATWTPHSRCRLFISRRCSQASAH